MGRGGWDKRITRCLCIWGLPVGFSPRAKVAQAQALVLHLTRECRRDGRRGKRLGSGAGAVGGACYAWNLLVRRKAGDGPSHDAKAAPEREGGRPRAGTRTHEGPYRSSLLNMGRRESFSRSKDTVSLPCCQAGGRAVRIIHHQEGQFHRRRNMPPLLRFFSLLATSEQPVVHCAGMSGLCRGHRHPAEYAASEVYSYDRATLVTGEEAALPLEFAAGDDVFIG